MSTLQSRRDATLCAAPEPAKTRETFKTTRLSNAVLSGTRHCMVNANSGTAIAGFVAVVPFGKGYVSSTIPPPLQPGLRSPDRYDAEVGGDVVQGFFLERGTCVCELLWRQTSLVFLFFWVAAVRRRCTHSLDLRDQDGAEMGNSSTRRTSHSALQPRLRHWISAASGRADIAKHRSPTLHSQGRCLRLVDFQAGRACPLAARHERSVTDTTRSEIIPLREILCAITDVVFF